MHVLVAQEADTIAVPDVRGETEERALADLVDAGLVPGGRFRAYDSPYARGEGSADRPQHRHDGGTWDHRRVHLVARATTPTHPDKRTVDRAGWQLPMRGPRPCPEQIEDAGMVVGKVVPGSPESDGSWLVQDQDPAPGAEVDQGTTIRLTVTDPAEPCT